MAHYVHCHSETTGVVVWRKFTHEEIKKYRSPMWTRYCVTSTLIWTRPAQRPVDGDVYVYNYSSVAIKGNTFNYTEKSARNLLRV